MSLQTALLIFARYPVPGKAKTRLVPALGPDRAARLHRRMTEHAVGTARAACEADKNSNVKITLCCTGGRLQDFRAWLGHEPHYVSQPSGDLGTRLHWAFKTALRNNAAGTIAIGSDVPGITSTILQQALESLRDHDIVLGPAADGGYYLIGMKRFHQELFTAIDWGTERVCNQTRAAIARLRLDAAELPMLCDVDRPEDLPLLRTDPRFADVFLDKPLLSVIIPTLNEAGTIKKVLDRVHAAPAVEVIVADGGSQDATREIALQSGARVMEVPGGRAAQQNIAAAVAKGRLLLFLHADTLLPENYADLIREALDSPSTIAGAFRFQTDDSRMTMQLIEKATNFRSTFFQWPYGDQGLFMEKRVFQELGGFVSQPIMEDLELVRRLRQRGTIVTLRDAAVTSARRWQQLGIVRTTIINQIMIAGFLCNVPIDALARFYRKAGRGM